MLQNLLNFYESNRGISRYVSQFTVENGAGAFATLAVVFAVAMLVIMLKNPHVMERRQD